MDILGQIVLSGENKPESRRSLSMVFFQAMMVEK